MPGCPSGLQAPSSSLRILFEPMSQPFPRLGDLFLLFTTTEALSPVLPDTLRVPFLRSLALHGIGLPKGLSSSYSMFHGSRTQSCPSVSSRYAAGEQSLLHAGCSTCARPAHRQPSFTLTAVTVTFTSALDNRLHRRSQPPVLRHRLHDYYVFSSTPVRVYYHVYKSLTLACNHGAIICVLASRPQRDI